MNMASAASLVVVTERAAVPCADALAGRQRDAVVFTAEERRWMRDSAAAVREVVGVLKRA